MAYYDETGELKPCPECGDFDCRICATCQNEECNCTCQDDGEGGVIQMTLDGGGWKVENGQ